MKKFSVKHLIGLIVECCAFVLLALCIFTDINDELFLPMALGCVSIGSFIGLAIQIQARKEDKETHSK